MTRELRADLLTETVEAPTLVDANDLARLMRCSPWTVHRMAREGHFPKPVTQVGRSSRWLTRDYVAHIEQEQARRDA